MREFLTGAKAYWRGWKLAWREHLWPYLFLPGLISVWYFPAVAFLGYRYGGKVVAYLRDNWLPEFMRHQTYVVMLTILLTIVALYVGFVLFRNVVMILYSPVLSILSRKTEERAGAGTNLPTETSSAVKGMIRGIGMSVISLALALLCLVGCMGLLLVPVLGQIAMVVLLPLSQMFLAGLGFMDPTLERRGFGVMASFRFAWRHRARVLGGGAVFLLLAGIPVLGWFLAPTLGIVAGTLLVLDLSAAETRP